ncbi:hypothetical protein ACFE04_028471 [Oxalis oulophora]
MVSSSSSKKITLKSSDNELFEVDEADILISQMIKNMIDGVDCCVEEGFPNVTATILAKVIEYCKKHSAANDSTDRNLLKSWDADFVNVDQETLFDLIMAANYLKIQSLLDLTCQTVANMIRGKTPEEIRQTFHIQNDYTPEEEEQVRKEMLWAFE